MCDPHDIRSYMSRDAKNTKLGWQHLMSSISTRRNWSFSVFHFVVGRLSFFFFSLVGILFEWGMRMRCDICLRKCLILKPHKIGMFRWANIHKSTLHFGPRNSRYTSPSRSLLLSIIPAEEHPINWSKYLTMPHRLCPKAFYPTVFSSTKF